MLVLLRMHEVKWGRANLTFFRLYKGNKWVILGFLWCMLTMGSGTAFIGLAILSLYFIKKFNGKIINIHPSLLPKYKGLNTHKKAIENNDKFAGCSVHFVTAKLDSGKIIMQKKVKIKKGDTIASLTKKVLKKEHLLYPAAIKKIYN